MTEKENYQRWRTVVSDEELHNDLISIADDENAIYDRFYRNLEFGTAGLRGVFGAGTNRINIFTIRQATQGLSVYLNTKYESASCAIAYDTRHNSKMFAEEAASVLAANGIRVWIYSDPAPTPMLSYAVRERSCSAGIVITASHNPKNYNGYKVYSPNGCQIDPETAKEISSYIDKVDALTGFDTSYFGDKVKSGMIKILPDSFWRRYYARVIKEGVDRDHHYLNNVTAVYTPLNGTGAIPVINTLSLASFGNVEILESQKKPDPDFTTCPYPNPELGDAMKLAVERAKEIKADIVFGTDPDCDRLGLVSREKDGNYRLFSGNEVGCLFLDFICRSRKENNNMPDNPIAVRSIVSTKLADDIASAYGVEMKKVFTGFRFIGKEIEKLEETNSEERFIFGFEESCGYLTGTYVRDKDGVVASLLAMECANYWKLRGKTLGEAMDDIQNEFGYWSSKTSNYVFEGKAGAEKIKFMMDSLRQSPPTMIADTKVSKINDYYPDSNMIEITLSDESSVIVRPSGTEPKIKTYCFAKKPEKENAESRISELVAATESILGL